MDAMNRGDEHGKAMCGEFYFLLRPERQGGPPVLSRESVCVDVNLKDTPRIFVSFAFAGVGIVSTSFSQQKQGIGKYSRRRRLAGTTLPSSSELLVGTGAGS